MSQSGTTTIETSLPPQDDEDAYAPDPSPEDVEPQDVEVASGEPERRGQGLTPTEQRAYQKGWRPLHQYRGAPGSWISAEEFLRRGEENLSLLRSDLHRAIQQQERMASENKELRALIERQGAAIADMAKQREAAEKMGYDRAIAEQRERRRAAAASGDMVSYVDADEKISEIEERRAAVAPAPIPAPAAPAPQPEPQINPGAYPPEVEAFVRDNDWFRTDRVLNLAMQTAHIDLLDSAPGLSLADNLKQAKERVMAQYPRKFGLSEQQPAKQPPRGPSQPRPGTPPRTPSKGLMRIEDAAERAEAARGFASARNSMPDLTEDEYVDIYLDPKADVLAARAARKAAK